MNIYSLNDIGIQTDLDLYPLQKKNIKPEVTIESGIVPEHLPLPIATTASYEITTNCTLIRIPRMGRFLVTGSHHICIQLDGHLQPEECIPILLGPVWASMLHRRGAFPLAGSLLDYHGNGILLCGPSASGVSTMALALTLQASGVKTLSDEFCLIEQTAHGMLAKPGLPALKLWQDVLESQDIDYQALKHTRNELNKFWLPLPASDPIRLHMIIELHEQKTDADSEGPTQIKGFKAFTMIDRLTLHLAYLRHLPLQQQQFIRCTELARHVTVLRYTFKYGLDHLSEQASTLLEAFEAP